jgi:hypothetical protein
LLSAVSRDPEFVASYNAAVAQKATPPSGVLLALLFRFQESAEFQFGISLRTRRDYIKQIKRIKHAFRDFPKTKRQFALMP